ncbi:MAG TPA: glycerophosphodiester phosphodiesterase [Thermoleophilaceae bacterium]|nr:glycerophosphodiester phosphodiesterase [Thermoleophilaceae bacterium]
MTAPGETRPLIRVGHKGADHVAPGNTAESFEAALALGVDMIEFDVMPLRDGTLVLAHDPEDAAGRAPLTLEEGLEHFAAEAYADVELDVDLKAPGYEVAVVEGLRERGLLERSLISSTYPESLRLVRQLDPDVRRGWSVPRVRRDLRKHPVLKYVAYGAVAWWRSGLPAKAERALRRGDCEALMSHYVLVTRQLVQRVKAAGGQLYVWTVDDANQIARLERLGVDAVITNDPRLFD